jgi:hypothetical protein
LRRIGISMSLRRHTMAPAANTAATKPTIERAVHLARQHRLRLC